MQIEKGRFGAGDMGERSVSCLDRSEFRQFRGREKHEFERRGKPRVDRLCNALGCHSLPLFERIHFADDVPPLEGGKHDDGNDGYGSRGGSERFAKLHEGVGRGKLGEEDRCFELTTGGRPE